METKITSASVRISLSCNYNTFEVALNIENADGLHSDEITQYRLRAQEMANEAVADYKLTLEAPPQFTKTPFKAAKQVINVNNVKPDSDGSEIGVKDNATISEIANLPPYTKFKSDK